MSEAAKFFARVGVVIVAGVLVMTGCAGDDSEPFPLDTLPAQPTTPGPDATTPAEDDGGSAESEVPLPQECSAVISYSDVAQTLGVPLTGGVTPIFVDGGFHEDSGRLQRLTCRYNWVDEMVEDPEDAEEDAESAQVLEISISSYVDAERASARVRDTVDGTSGEVEPIEVSGTSSFILRGGDTATFVAAQGEYTYVASLLREAMRDEALEDAVLILLAEKLLDALDTGDDSDGDSDDDDEAEGGADS